jgi:hypothetical protein
MQLFAAFAAFCSQPKLWAYFKAGCKRLWAYFGFVDKKVSTCYPAARRF